MFPRSARSRFAGSAENATRTAIAQRDRRNHFRELQIPTGDLVSGRLSHVPVQEGNERATDSPADRQRLATKPRGICPVAFAPR